MSYLFSIRGRINRAKVWLFLLVGIAWKLVVVTVAMFGLHWTRYLDALREFSQTHMPFQPAPIPWPDPIAGNDWIALGVIALLVLLYVVALLAVYTKRLHDRNKSAWWLVPYVALPSALSWFVLGTGSARMFPLGLWEGPLGIARGVMYVAANLITLWVIVELWFLRGTNGENRFGPDPLA